MRRPYQLYVLAVLLVPLGSGVSTSPVLADEAQDRLRLEKDSWIESLTGNGMVDLICSGECLRAEDRKWRSDDNGQFRRFVIRVDQVWFDRSGSIQAGQEIECSSLYVRDHPGYEGRVETGPGVFRFRVATEVIPNAQWSFHLFSHGPAEPLLVEWLARLAKECRPEPRYLEVDHALGKSLSDFVDEDWSSWDFHAKWVLRRTWRAEVSWQLTTHRRLLHSSSPFWEKHLDLFSFDEGQSPDPEKIRFLYELIERIGEPKGYREALTCYVQNVPLDWFIDASRADIPFLTPQLVPFFQVRVAESLIREIEEGNLDRIKVLLHLFPASQAWNTVGRGPVPEILLRPLGMPRPTLEVAVQKHERFWQVLDLAIAQVNGYSTLGVAVPHVLRVLLEDPTVPYDLDLDGHRPGNDLRRVQAELSQAGCSAAKHLCREVEVVDEAILARAAGMPIREAVTRAFDRALAWPVREQFCESLPLDRPWTFDLVLRAASLDPRKEVRKAAGIRLAEFCVARAAGAAGIEGVDDREVRATVEALIEERVLEPYVLEPPRDPLGGR